MEVNITRKLQGTHDFNCVWSQSARLFRRTPRSRWQEFINDSKKITFLSARCFSGMTKSIFVYLCTLCSTFHRRKLYISTDFAWPFTGGVLKRATFQQLRQNFINNITASLNREAFPGVGNGSEVPIDAETNASPSVNWIESRDISHANCIQIGHVFSSGTCH